MAQPKEHNKPIARQSVRLTEAVQLVHTDDDGDILTLLRRLRDKYLAKAAETDEKAFGPKREQIKEAAERYRDAADAVGILITQGLELKKCEEETSAPVDQTEEILSDIAVQQDIVDSLT